MILIGRRAGKCPPFFLPKTIKEKGDYESSISDILGKFEKEQANPTRMSYIGDVVDNNDPKKLGRIKVRINGFDFTQSPIKIRVSYLDENYNIAIDTNPVELVINPREVHVIPYIENSHIQYDGLEHPYDINNFKVVKDNGEFCEQVNTLYAGEKIQLIAKCYNETYGYVLAPINAATYQFYGYEVACSEDILANYTIIVDEDVPVEFIITPIEVEISPKLR